MRKGKRIMKKRLYPLTQVLLGTFVVLAGWSAMSPTSVLAADDAKIYPGNYCRPYDWNTPTVQFHTDGSLFNAHTRDWLIVLCPMIRDLSRNGDGVTFALIRFEFENSGPSQQVFCEVTTRYFNNGVAKKFQHGRSNLGYQRGTISIPYGGNAGYGTYYTLYCALPPRAGIESIMFHEHD